MKYYYLSAIHLAMCKSGTSYELITLGRTSTCIEVVNSEEPPCIPFKDEEITEVQYNRIKRFAEAKGEHLKQSNGMGRMGLVFTEQEKDNIKNFIDKLN